MGLLLRHPAPGTFLEWVYALAAHPKDFSRLFARRFWLPLWAMPSNCDPSRFGATTWTILDYI
ncbi:hypothetical protein YGS_C1P3138 [Sphingobium sp. YG1]|nr:hypothetical protein YGS_C1P3138 [Sphingobium sp. YG1]